MNRRYHGFRTHHGKAEVEIIDGAAFGATESSQLNPRFDLFRHSPTGFEWGYEGSGPAQLALAILCDHFARIFLAERVGSEKGVDLLAVRLHQPFKRDVIAKLAQGGEWTLTDRDVTMWLFRSSEAQRTIVEWDADAQIAEQLEAKAVAAEREASDVGE